MRDSASFFPVFFCYRFFSYSVSPVLHYVTQFRGTVDMSRGSLFDFFLTPLARAASSALLMRFNGFDCRASAPHFFLFSRRLISLTDRLAAWVTRRGSGEYFLSCFSPFIFRLCDFVFVTSSVLFSLVLLLPRANFSRRPFKVLFHFSVPSPRGSSLSAPSCT